MTPAFLLPVILGFAYAGTRGMWIGALIGYGFSLAGQALQQVAQRRAVSREREAFKADLGAKLEAIAARLPASPGFYKAMLDEMPVEHGALLGRLMGPRTQDEWNAVWPKVWPLLRRRLVDGAGLNARAVEGARESIMDRWASGGSLPQTSEGLAAMVEQWAEVGHSAGPNATSGVTTSH